MAFDVICTSCTKHLGKSENFEDFPDLVIDHLLTSPCKAKRVIVRCSICDQELETGPELWIGRAEAAAEYDEAWSKGHQHGN